MKQSYQPAVIPPTGTHEPSWWFAFRGQRLLVRMPEAAATDASATVPELFDFSEIDLPVVRRQYLGRLNGRHCYSVELEKDAQPPAGWLLLGLRRLYGLLPESLFLVAGAAVQIVDWDRTHQFCGRCGARMGDKARERAKECPECGLISYPRISPAIIVLVQRDDKLLLARSHRHPQGLFSVLAGFVEPGETLESAVAREIREETGIEVSDIRYFGSQPWPFPNSLMIAFTCHYAGGEIVLEQEEIAEAGWYTADAMPPVPPKISIARQLIDWFAAQGAGEAPEVREWTFKE
jgi:NAD+ diphosphatase